MNESMALSATGLRKTYGDKVVLDGIDLSVPAGTIFALLGPNGAGKTTTVQILSTLIRSSGGDARVAGHDLAREPDAVRAAIGVTGQFSAVDNLLTAQENLILMADLHHLDRGEARRRASSLLRQFDLADVAGKTAATFSGGMRRRLDLAMTLVGRPRVIFLDEPTTGLDPRSRRTMWDIIRSLAAEGVTIFLTTQYLEEADQLADRIAVLDHGRLVAEGTAEELKRLVPGGHVSLRFGDENGLARIRDLEEQRLRIADLVAGERLFLPPEVVRFLDEVRAMGVSPRGVRLERDGWILIAARVPDDVRVWVEEKRSLLSDPEFRKIYLACDEAYDWDPGDPRLEELADALAAYGDQGQESTWTVDDPIVLALVGSQPGGSSPAWDRLARLAEDRTPGLAVPD